MLNKIVVTMVLVAGLAACGGDEEPAVNEPNVCTLYVNDSCVANLRRGASNMCARFADDFNETTTDVWRSGSTSCATGSLSDTAREDALRRLNLHRWLSNKPALGWVPEQEDAAAECAVIQSKMNSLSHFPPPSSTCYTQDGHDSAEQSNLALGDWSPAAAMTGLFNDFGANNAGVLGHRRWFLNPLGGVALGFANSGASPATCVWLDWPDSSETSDIADFQAFPYPGPQPYELIAENNVRLETAIWSFTAATDFSQATATLTDADSGDTIAADWGLLESTPGWDDGIWLQPNAHLPIGSYIMTIANTDLGDISYRVDFHDCGFVVPSVCDPIAQNCKLTNVGCFLADDYECVESRQLASEGESCQYSNDCEIGTACLSTGQSASECYRYCSINGSEQPCSDCPGSVGVIDDEIGVCL